jgi:hypothetical protein
MNNHNREDIRNYDIAVDWSELSNFIDGNSQ